LGGGSVEARKTLSFGEIVSALKHSICHHLSPSFTFYGEVLVLIITANLSSKAFKSFIDIGKEATQVGCVVCAAPLVQ